MKPIYKLYLKSFLVTGIIYGIFNLVFNFIDGGEIQWGGILFKTIGFGLFMSLFLGTMQKNTLKELGIREFTDENIGVSQRKIVASPLDRDAVIEKLKSEPAFAKLKFEEIENGLKFKTRISWKSWGEEICIISKGAGQQEFEYVVTSRPTQKHTLVDYGKNIENIQRIEKAISSIA